MAYVYTWAQILNLLGSRDSDEIDDSSREAKAGLDERFRSIIRDVEADPWVLLGSNLVTRYPWSIGHASVVTGTLGVGNSVSPIGAAAATIVTVPVIVPVGSRLVGVKFRFNISGAASANGTVFKTDAVASPLQIGAVATAAGAGWNNATIGVVSSLCAAGESYHASVIMENNGGQASFLDMEVTLEGS